MQRRDILKAVTGGCVAAASGCVRLGGDDGDAESGGQSGGSGSATPADGDGAGAGTKTSSATTPEPTAAARSTATGTPTATATSAEPRGDSSSIDSLSRAWSTSLDTAAHPAADGDTVYAGASDETVTAYAAASGEPRWSADISGVPTGYGLVAADETVLVCVANGDVYALEPATGETRWRRSVVGEPTGAAVVDGTAYVAASEGTLSAVDLRSGAVDWRTDVDVARYNTETVPAVAGGLVLHPSDDAIHAYSRHTGNEAWTAEVSGSMADSTNGMAVTPEAAYVTGDDGYVARLDYDAGSVGWETTVDDGDLDRPFAAGETVYAGGSSVHALESTAGSEQWAVGVSLTHETLQHAPGSLLLPGADNADNAVFRIADDETGVIKWEDTFESADYFTRPAITDRAVGLVVGDDYDADELVGYVID